MEHSLQEIQLSAGGNVLCGDLVLPRGAHGLVLFAHGSGSSRKSPRNQFVAKTLNQMRLGTLLFDLLTEQEELEDSETGRLRFDIRLLASRLVAAIDWAKRELPPEIKLGLFGASTGAAAALVAAAQRPDDVRAVVSRGGRPDLAGDFLPRVQAPTLLLVGERDELVIELNEKALARLPGEKRLLIVPHATHLFEEPGTLEAVADEAKRWFDFFLHKEPQEGLFLDGI